MHPKKILRLAMAQLLVEGGEPERNLARAIDKIKEAKALGAELVLLPECLDLAWTHPSIETLSEPIPGKFSQILCQAAQDIGIYVCAGLTERKGAKFYNSAILINSQGEIILLYRKINILEQAQQYYSIGDRLGVVETPFGTIGLNICSDNYQDGLPLGHSLARMGAELILAPSSWTVDFSVTENDNPYGLKWLKPYQTLSSLYGLSIVGTTSVGTIVGGPFEGRKMIGCSLAVGPQGIIAQGSYNEFSGEIIMANIPMNPPVVRGTAMGNWLKNRGCDFEVTL